MESGLLGVAFRRIRLLCRRAHESDAWYLRGRVVRDHPPLWRLVLPRLPCWILSLLAPPTYLPYHPLGWDPTRSGLLSRVFVPVSSSLQPRPERIDRRRSWMGRTNVHVGEKDGWGSFGAVWSMATVPVRARHGPPPAWPGRAVAPERLQMQEGPRKFSLLGSTGSIGTQTLDIVREHNQDFAITALGAGRNVSLLVEQTAEFRPELVSVQDAATADQLVEALRDRLGPGVALPEVMHGMEGAVAVAEHAEAQAVVTGIVGCAGLRPTVAAIRKGKDICLANKETLIAGGPAVLPLAAEHDVKILPADSEHSAIFQSIQGLPENGLRRIILTASGGAFRDMPVEKLKDVKVEDALKHPNWSMGRKITVDSATLMNKGLEVIEAHYLFGVDYDNIEIVIHPQSIIHSMVETADSSVIGQLGWPDMRLPILYTMSWPRRIQCSEDTWKRLDFVKMGDLTFREPDHAKYPSMEVAYAAGRKGGTMTGVLSAANEQAVEMFLDKKIGYLDIIGVVEAACDKHCQDFVEQPTLEEIIHFDQWARHYVKEVVESSAMV